MKHSLLYFVKYPTPGKVKTRLAKTVGAEEAARIYRSLAEENFETLRPLAQEGISVAVLFDPPRAESMFRSWLTGEIDYFPQEGEGLGERLGHAFRTAFENGARRVIAIGSDTLGLEADLVREAFRALGHEDVVLGPARDGGYYLIGLSRFEPRIFQGIPWSTSKVFQTTLSRAKELGLSCFSMKELEDVDERVPV